MTEVRHNWTLEEIAEIYNRPLMELVFEAATMHRKYHNPEEVQVSSLISIKTGGCPEDCAYCPQAARYHTDIKVHKLMEVDEVRAQAESAKANGASRMCLGAAWREVRDNRDFDKVLDMVKTVNSMDMEVCCTLGMVSEDQAKKLADAGLYAYNHNIDTSEAFYDDIISTREYDDRLKTIENVRKAKITVCSGGIIGMGESAEDRMGMLLTLANMEVHPESVPVNALVPVEGTPLAEQPRVAAHELIRMIATARLVMPASVVRLSAGREGMSLTEQALCFMAGANSIFAGDKLLTTPNPDFNDDKEMFDLLGLKPREAFKYDKKSLKWKHKFIGLNSYQQALEERKKQQLLRTLPLPPEGIDFYSNDYLGLAQSPELAQAIRAISIDRSIQNGSTGSRLLSGNSAYMERVEQLVADFHESESALIYSSGYTANLGLISCLATRETTLFCDELIHASLIDGARLGHSKRVRFSHNDPSDLDKKLKEHSGQKIVIVEAIYSMDGDTCPLKDVIEVCNKNEAQLIVDEAHSMAVCGEKGAGLVQELGLQNQILARIMTYGKGPGIHGAAVVGPTWLRDYQINFSRSMIFSTAPAVHQFYAIEAMYKQLPEIRSVRDRLKSNISYFVNHRTNTTTSWLNSNSQIQSLIVPGNKEVVALGKKLSDAGINALPIRKPSVAEGSERIRFCIHAYNSKEEIDQLFNVLSNE